MHPRQPLGPAAQPHAEEIVAGKDRVALDRADGHHDPARQDQVEKVGGGDRDQRPLVDPDRGGLLQYRHAGPQAQVAEQGVDLGPDVSRRDLLANSPFVRQEHGLAGFRRRAGGR